MKFLTLLIMLLFSVLSYADQNADIIKNNKLTISTTIMNPAITSLQLNCLSNRNIILTGTFNGTQEIKLPSANCVDGTRFMVHHDGTGDVIAKTFAGATLGTVSEGDTHILYFYNGTYGIFSYADENVGGGGGSFDPASVAASMLPATDVTYNIGDMTKAWTVGYINQIVYNKRGNNGSQPNLFTNKLVIQTREAEDTSSSTGFLWMRTGHSLGGNDYTGMMSLTTGTANATTNPSTNADARTGGILLATGRATPKGTGTATIGGILIATGGAPSGSSNSASHTQPTEDVIQVISGKGNIIRSNDGVNRITKGAVSVEGIATYTISTTDCPSGSCTAAAPLQFSLLGSTPAITNALCVDGLYMCASEIIIRLQNTSWTGNTADKYVCINGINQAQFNGQRLRVRLYNGTNENSTVAQRVTNLHLQFASAQNPIAGCVWNTAGRITLKHEGNGTAYPAVGSYVLRSQFQLSQAGTSAGQLYPLSIGSVEFEYTTAGQGGWTQI